MSFGRKPGRELWERGLSCLAAALLVAGLQAAPRPSPPGSAAGSRDVPFQVGEKLLYQVEWNPPWYFFFLPSMDAGELELSLADETEYKGKKALRIVFTARSSGTLAKLAGLKVDDRYEFITDPDTFCTHTAAIRIREGKRKHDIDLVYFPESRRLHIRDLDLSKDPPKVDKDEFRDDIPPCVQDLFSALYSVRRSELKAGATHKLLVGDNDKVKEIEAVVEKKERIDTPNGKFDAWRVNTIAVLGGLFKNGGEFRIWFSADAKKIPVKFEAKVKLGKVTGKLKGVENGPDKAASARN